MRKDVNSFLWLRTVAELSHFNSDTELKLYNVKQNMIATCIVQRNENQNNIEIEFESMQLPYSEDTDSKLGHIYGTVILVNGFMTEIITCDQIRGFRFLERISQ